MAKLTLTDVSAGYALTTSINSNNTAIENAIENTLSRDGTAPNTMQSALDMNSYNINNLPNATQNQQPVTLSQAASIAGVTNPLNRSTVGGVLYPQTSAETAAGVTPTDLAYPELNVLRYGASSGGGAGTNTTAIQNALDVANNKNDGGTVILPSGSYNINATLDMRAYNKVYMKGDGIARILMDTDNTPIIYFGSNDSGVATVSGGLSNLYLIYTNAATAAHTASICITLWNTAVSEFRNIWCFNCYSGIEQATDTGTASVNTVFENVFDQIYIYGFHGNGIKLKPINSGSTPNNWGKVYINGGGNDVQTPLWLESQADHFDALNIENLQAQGEAVVYITTGGSGCTFNHLYMENVSVDSTVRGMIHVRSNPTWIGMLAIHNSTWDNADASTVKIISYSFGYIDIGLIRLSSLTLTGSPTVKLLHAYDSTSGPAYRVRIGGIYDLSSYISTYGDITDEYILSAEIDGWNSNNSVTALPTADATPSVQGVGRATITNASPQNITGFDDGYAGQVLQIRALDGNTTFVHSATTPGVRMFGGSNATLTSGQVIEFVNYGSGIWVETSRSWQAQVPYTVNNGSTDRLFDANAAAGTISATPTQAEVENIRDAVLELADVVGTVITDLQGRGIFQ